MRVQRQRLVRVASVVAVAVSGIVAALLHVPPAQAQCRPGNYALQQSGTVGWVYVNSDHTAEWWAYIEGAYQWADSSSVGTSKWTCDAEYTGDDSWPSYAAWKADVLERSEALGHVITFQQHAVVEESVSD